jgi:hypothetical protein
MAEVYTHINHILLELSSQVPDVVFSVAGGVKNNDVSLTLSCPLSGASIYYTTDGSDPDDGDTLYAGAIDIDSDTTIKAKAYKAGYTASVIREEVYTFKCATPVITPSSGTYPAEQSAEITCASTGATIYYTTDGSTPDDGDTEYTTAIDITADTTLKAIAIDADYDDSNIAIAVFDISYNYFLVGGDYFDVEGEHFTVAY